MGKVAKTKKQKTAAEEAWEQYQAIQLTPEQKAELRAELQKKIDAARAAGVYERIAEMRGKYSGSLSWQELRDKDE